MAETASVSGDFTEDALLDGAVKLRQPRTGFRAAIDSVLLAAAVPATAGERVFEPGAGTGAAALCLAHRVEGATVTGIELQPGLVRLAGENVRLNGFDRRVEIMVGDLTRPLPLRISGPFDHVMLNPPYTEDGHGRRPPDAGKAWAHVETGAGLDAWIGCALGQLRSKGTLTLIQRADRLDQVLSTLKGRVGEVVVFPLWPGNGKAAKRIIVQARRDVATPMRVVPGLILHGAGGHFTVAADAVLRGTALAVTASGE